MFVIEFCLRVYLAPTYQQIYYDISFWFEFASIISNFPMYVLIFMFHNKSTASNLFSTLISMFRSVRIFRFTRQITCLRVFIRSLMYSTRELFYLFVTFISIMFFFGELIYLNEEWRNDSAIQTVTGIDSVYLL